MFRGPKKYGRWRLISLPAIIFLQQTIFLTFVFVIYIKECFASGKEEKWMPIGF